MYLDNSHLGTAGNASRRTYKNCEKFQQCVAEIIEKHCRDNAYGGKSLELDSLLANLGFVALNYYDDKKYSVYQGEIKTSPTDSIKSTSTQKVFQSFFGYKLIVDTETRLSFTLKSPHNSSLDKSFDFPEIDYRPDYEKNVTLLLKLLDEEESVLVSWEQLSDFLDLLYYFHHKNCPRLRHSRYQANKLWEKYLLEAMKENSDSEFCERIGLGNCCIHYARVIRKSNIDTPDSEYFLLARNADNFTMIKHAMDGDDETNGFRIENDCMSRSEKSELRALQRSCEEYEDSSFASYFIFARRLYSEFLSTLYCQP